MRDTPAFHPETFIMWETRNKPATTTPTRTLHVPQSARAHFGATTSIKGRIQSREDIYIDGDFQGTLDVAGCQLTVGPNGRVSANALAREVIVFGAMNGDVDATGKVSVRQSGTLIGDIRAAGIVIEDEAYFKGKIDIITKERSAEESAGGPIDIAARRTA
jgi:cytoskeletal protein CcmA (bactofilin family)